jgi:hypothetical protein
MWQSAHVAAVLHGSADVKAEHFGHTRTCIHAFRSSGGPPEDQSGFFTASCGSVWRRTKAITPTLAVAQAKVPPLEAITMLVSHWATSFATDDVQQYQVGAVGTEADQATAICCQAVISS